MAQSKKQDNNIVLVDLGDTFDIDSIYVANDTWVEDDGTFTISLNDDTINVSDINIDTTTWTTDFNYNWQNQYVDINEVEQMCKEYPAIERAWRNFKAVYDLTYEDYKSKKDDEDDLPF